MRTAPKAENDEDGVKWRYDGGGGDDDKNSKA